MKGVKEKFLVDSGMDLVTLVRKPIVLSFT